MTKRSRVSGAVAVAALGLLSASSCSDQGPEIRDLRDEIEAHHRQWIEVRPVSYTYVVERLCFCGEEARGPVRVSVAGATVSHRVYVGTGLDVPESSASWFPSVDGLFALLLDALDVEAHEVRVVWDEASGAPVDSWIDYDLGIADEELGFRIVSLPQP